MKRSIMVVSVLFLSLSTLVLNGFVLVKGGAGESGFIIKLSVTYQNNGTENWIFTEEDRTIGLFMNNTWQMVELINHSHPIENITLDEDGNPIAFLQLPESELKPGESVNYTVTYRTLSKPRSLPNINEQNSETRDDIPSDLKDCYSGAEGPWLVNNPKLQDLAYNITKGETTVLAIVKKLIAWIRDNVTYETHDTPQYPNETYTEREGDCDDQALLFITLCRILEIPSYLQIGCIHMPATPPTQDTSWEGHLTTSLKHIGWHGWAIVYVPPWGWLPVDFTYVIGGLANPLNAIEHAAVVHFQEVIQYLNITRTDYVASSRTYRDLLKSNNFYVYIQDEMMEASPLNHAEDTIVRLFPWILVIATVVIIVTAAGIFVRASRRETQGRLNLSPGSAFVAYQTCGSARARKIELISITLKVSSNHLDSGARLQPSSRNSFGC